MGITNIGGVAMGQEELMDKIVELEREIAILPEGSITKKKIKAKEYYYHRITINGKRTENYLDFAEVSELKAQIEEQKATILKQDEIITRMQVNGEAS